MDKLFTTKFICPEGRDKNGELVKCVGFCLTSKRLSLNGYNTYLACNSEGIVIAVDGTYKLTINGWPLLLLGTDQALDDNKMKHSFIPFGLAWVMSEPQLAYEKLLNSYLDSLRVFFAVEGNINIAVGLCDHADAIK